jgi:hypothetical protein
VSNARSLPTRTRREHLPLDASLLNELSFSNFPLLYSSRSGVLCHPKPDAKQRALSLGRDEGQRKVSDVVRASLSQNRTVSVPVKSAYAASTRIAVLADAKFTTSTESRLFDRLLNIRAKFAPIISGPAKATGSDKRRVKEIPERPCFSAVKTRPSEITKKSSAPAHANGVTGLREMEGLFFMASPCIQFRVLQGC